MEVSWKLSEIEQFNIYQSADSDKESIKKNFILRHAEFQTIMDSLSRHAMQHELILGRRGCGKSTLLKRIETEIEEKLSQDYITINLAEEQAAIYRLFDLWLKVIEELKFRFSFQEETKDYSKFDNEQDYTRYLFQQIHAFCIAQKKQMALLLDNFDRIVENFTDKGDLLQEFLINYNDVVIIAASTIIDEHFWQCDKPFCELFRLHRPEALTIGEIKELINHWAEKSGKLELKKFVAKNPGKLQSIRIITDGLPRTFHFFIQSVVQNNYNESADYLKKIMDNMTPLYQEQLNSQPPQLRKIVFEMAFIWEACNTKELVEKCSMESKLISANLKTLSEKGVVDKIETDKRNLLYRISDRFFNMWLIMTQGNPEQKQKAKWLNLFLENWYNASLAETQDYEKAPEFPDTVENEDDAFISFDLGNIYRVQTIHSEAEKYFLSAIEKGQVGAIYNLGNLYVEQGKFAEAEWQYLSAIEKGHISAMYNLGLLYANQGKFTEAERQYLSAIGKGHVDSMYNLGLLYANQGKFTEAERQYLSAIEKGHTSAMYNLGNLYARQGKFTEAERQYLSAIEKGHTSAMYNLGNLYVKQGKFAGAEKQYLLAIEKGNTNAMYNLGNLYVKQDKFAEAEQYYLPAIEKGHINAMYNLGLLYDNQGRFAEAEQYYLLAIERGDINAICTLGVLYAKQGKFTEAEQQYLSAIEKNYNNAFYNLASLYYRRNRNKTDALEYIRQYEGNEALQIIIEIWNGIFNEVEQRTLAIVKENPDFLSPFIVELLSHQQKALILNLFNHPDTGQMLQDKLKALHYVCLLLNKKTENNLSLKIPPEIQTTINEIIGYIASKEKFYGYRK